MVTIFALIVSIHLKSHERVCKSHVFCNLKMYEAYSNILNPSRPNSGPGEKIKLNFYFHTSLWRLKRFYESLKGLSEMHGTGRVKFKQEKKSMKIPFAIYVNTESLLEKIHTCNNAHIVLAESFTSKINKLYSVRSYIIHTLSI